MSSISSRHMPGTHPSGSRGTHAVLRFATIAALLATLCGSQAAQAALGGTAASVQQDSTALRGTTVSMTSMQGYDRHEIKTADGANVREFASSDGAVFAVSFDGPAIPDLKTMLGTHYDDYLAAAKAHRGNHHVMSFVTSDGLSVSITKLPRGFRGEAHLPALLPRGVAVQDLR